MENTVSNNANLSEVIINTINNLLGSLFSSIDNSVYDTLDNLAFIDVNILNNSFFERAFGQGSNSSLLFIANSLLTAVCIYYCFKERFLCGKGGEKIGEIFVNMGFYTNLKSTKLYREYYFLMSKSVQNYVQNVKKSPKNR